VSPHWAHEGGGPVTLTTCLDCGTPSRGSRCLDHTAARTAFKNAVYGDPSYRSARAALLGRPCELRLPGCTGVADTADHVVPVSRGGAGGPLRPACLHCNSGRRDRA
jgi:hypothetical protein